MARRSSAPLSHERLSHVHNEYGLPNRGGGGKLMVHLRFHFLLERGCTCTWCRTMYRVYLHLLGGCTTTEGIRDQGSS